MKCNSLNPEIIFPVKYLIRSVPEPLTAPVPAPDPADCEKYGQYLVKIGGCADCHYPAGSGATHRRIRVRWRLADARSVGRCQHRQHHA